ncbi:hypothetical protein GJ744_000191 [Endocarpon pusillum]|uniref:NADH-ubiquinone oxidoreductase B12 subunit n=1 Tax=Endocarpon pusillum TaxID=364733 RepID=A0A8H7EC47_9EURO|nr:hypothetical protein GJ744_000191 [Endocarpon pusillum]
MAPSNPTGFDKSTLVEASTSRVWQSRDPWARAEQWRYTGPFTRYNRFRRAFPGLGIATVAFAAYLAYEAAFMKDEHHGHGEGHGDQHSGMESPGSAGGASSATG